MKPIRILVVDDHDLVRAGFHSLLKAMSGVEVLGEAGDGRQALEQVEALRPDVVLMDIMMPEMNGLDATARITVKFPGTRVIILSMNTAEEYVLQALRVGATGYLLKNVNPVELEQAVRAAAKGEPHFTPAIAKHIVTGFLSKADKGEHSLERLTPRQREVLQLVAEGNTSKIIAKKLGISVKTAEMHRSELMNALDIHDTAGLVRYAIRMGLITADA